MRSATALYPSAVLPTSAHPTSLILPGDVAAAAAGYSTLMFASLTILAQRAVSSRTNLANASRDGLPPGSMPAAFWRFLTSVACIALLISIVKRSAM